MSIVLGCGNLVNEGNRKPHAHNPSMGHPENLGHPAVRHLMARLPVFRPFLAATCPVSWARCPS